MKFRKMEGFLVPARRDEIWKFAEVGEPEFENYLFTKAIHITI